MAVNKDFKMTPEQKALFDDLTKLQQEVAINSLSGMSNIDAYRNSKGKAKTISAQEASASEILNNPKVKAFLTAMKETAIGAAVMSRERMLELLTKISDVDSGDLKLMSAGQLSELKGGFDVKLKAMKQLAELAGYDAPSKVETKVITDSGESEW